MERNVKYSPYVVTFFDILGFRSLVQSEEPFAILNALDGLGCFRDETSLKGTSVKFVAFSDSVVRARSIPVNADPATLADILETEVLDLAMAQVNATLNRIWVRGALCIGDLYIDRNAVFGPGLVKAYDLASSIAKYPRIIVENETLYSLNREDHNQKLGTSALYIQAEHDELGFTPLATFLGEHKDLIVHGAPPSNSLTGVSLKYNWLARFHNDYVSGLSDEVFAETDWDRGELFIPAGVIKSLLPPMGHIVRSQHDRRKRKCRSRRRSG